MDFEEKLDAMRVTLELAVHDIEAQRTRIDAITGAIDALRLASASQYESIHELMGISQNLVIAVQSHEQKITKLERRA